ncbi:MAG: hypothetical protein ACE5FC_10905 [Myxococcota bacterium]
MKAFSTNNYRITSASSNLRLVLGLFLVLVLLGFATNIFLTYQQTGFTPEGITTYYRGAEDAAGETLSYPKSARELLMNAHFHLFMMPLILLVLCHVFYMTSASDFLKKAITWAAFGAVLGEITGPWMVRFLSAGFAVLMLFSNLLLAAALLVLILTPLYELWFKPCAPNTNSARPR